MKFDFQSALVTFPVTLYKARGGTLFLASQSCRRWPDVGGARGAQDSVDSPKFQKKTVTLAVCEVADKDGSSPSQVGSLVLNLADYADAAGLVKKLPVAVATAVSAACGQPLLSVTIRRAPHPPPCCPTRVVPPPV